MAKPKSEKEFLHTGFFVVRTPLLSFDQFLNWSQDLKAPAALGDSESLDNILQSDRIELRNRLRAAISRPELREAIFIASPDLDEGIERWLRAPDSEKGQRVERALVRYFSRITGRATPFGLFAGCSVGYIGAETAISVDEASKSQRHTRLDMDYLYALIEALERDELLTDKLRYYPNSSLYRAAGRLRYVETRLSGEIRSHYLVAVDDSAYLNLLLAAAGKGATRSDLAVTLLEYDAEITIEEAQDFINELIESKLLVSELRPVVTGEEPLNILIAQLKERAPDCPAIDRLSAVQNMLNELDAAQLGLAKDRYLTIAKVLEALPAKVELPRLFQVDMVRPVITAELGEPQIEELMHGIEALHRLFPTRPDSDLEQFRRAFVERYGEGREVPLVEALDEEVGIGFSFGERAVSEASPLLRELNFPPLGQQETTEWGARHRLINQKLQAALRLGRQEIVISQKDIEQLEVKERAPLPDSFACMAVLAAASQAALDSGDYRWLLLSASGPSGMRLLGRFCHADKELCKLVESHLRTEEALDPDALFAEIVHLPEGRIGNILLRPLLRGYEIPFIGRSGVAEAQQIPITDLMITVWGNRVLLRSQRLNRMVRPRLSSAHNFSARSLSLYRFLCVLQSQEVSSGLLWNWGALQSSPFLPRVSMGRIVLARARWNVTKEELQELVKLQGRALFQSVNRWRIERAMPRFVKLVEFDNELPVDFDNILSIENFINTVKNREQQILMEFFPGPDELCVHGKEGRFVHELVIPFVRKREATKPSSAQTDISSDNFPRLFVPGSEWLYVKLYTGTSTADLILSDLVKELRSELMASGVIDRWFFIRYGDPNWHLRVRFHGDPALLMREAVPRLHAKAEQLLANGQLFRMQFDTYEREVERYGGYAGIEWAEKLFHVDSDAVLEIVALFSGDEGIDARWQLTVRAIDMLLNDFGFDMEQKLAIMQRLRDAFAREFKADTTDLKHQLGKKFMKERKRLEFITNPDIDQESPLAPGLEILEQRSMRIRSLVDEVKDHERSGRMTAPVSELVKSYIHMHVNRMLRSLQRPQELVIYDLLVRLYESQVARMRIKK